MTYNVASNGSGTPPPERCGVCSAGQYCGCPWPIVHVRACSFHQRECGMVSASTKYMLIVIVITNVEIVVFSMS